MNWRTESTSKSFLSRSLVATQNSKMSSVLWRFQPMWLSTNALLTTLQQQDLDSAPPIVKPQAPSITPFDMQIVVANQQDGCKVFLAHFQFSEKVDARHFHTMCIGEPQFIEYGKHFRSGTLAFQWLLQKLTGWSVLCYTTQIKTKAGAKVKSKSGLDEGFAFIRAGGPRSNVHNRQIEWTEIDTHREDNPIFGCWFGARKFERLCVNQCLCRACEWFPLHIAWHPWLVLHDCLYPVLPTLKDITLVLLGLTEKGKILVAQAVAMAMSEYWLVVDQKDQELEPSFCLAASLDQLRGDPGVKYRPHILDDADTSAIPISKMKGFLDSNMSDAFTVERWTAAKFVKHQLRIVCVSCLQTLYSSLKKVDAGHDVWNKN